LCGCCCNGSSNGIGDREAPFTRIVEHKHFEMMGEAVHQVPKTIITKEYPAEYSASAEAYYPIICDDYQKGIDPCFNWTMENYRK